MCVIVGQVRGERSSGEAEAHTSRWCWVVGWPGALAGEYIGRVGSGRRNDWGQGGRGDGGCGVRGVRGGCGARGGRRSACG